MKIRTNKFGSGKIYEADDLEGKIYAVCSACMSIHTEFLSWCNANKERMTNNLGKADSVVVLGCQVTDLAVLNDMRMIEELKNTSYAVKPQQFYMGGCLAKRFDIELPDWVRRLDNVSSDNTPINLNHYVLFQRPFWVKDFEENYMNDLTPGNLFRHDYPIRIGMGCKHNCTYCTINTTRGQVAEFDLTRIKTELESRNPIVFIADNTTTEQIETLGKMLLDMGSNAPAVSFRNVEPRAAMEALPILYRLASEQILRVFHCPVQSDREETLRDMQRDIIATMPYMASVVGRLQGFGVKVATNIIIDYKDFPNPECYPTGKNKFCRFDYLSWNPYWDGKWNWQNAEERMSKYIG